MLKMTAFGTKILQLAQVASVSSIRFLLSTPLASLLLYSSIRYLAYLVAWMATNKNLRTGQRPCPPLARLERRQTQPSRLSSRSNYKHCIDAYLPQRRVIDWAHTLRNGLQAMCEANMSIGHPLSSREPGK